MVHQKMRASITSLRAINRVPSVSRVLNRVPSVSRVPTREQLNHGCIPHPLWSSFQNPNPSPFLYGQRMGASPLADSPGSFLRYKINKRSHDMMFQGIQFPEAPGRRDEQAAPPPSDDNRVTVGEIDFFAGKGRSAGHDQDHDDNNIHGSKTIRVSVEKDNSHGEEDPSPSQMTKKKQKLSHGPLPILKAGSVSAPRPGLDVDSGLHLFTANTGSDQSTVDYGISSDANDKLADAENKIAKSELQMELQRMNSENRRLKDRLALVTNNYSVLPMNPVASMQQQQNQGAAYTTQHHEVVESKSEGRKHEINVNGGAGSPADQTDEVSHASSEDRTISGSPRNASKNEVVREGKRVRLEESPESESQGWNPNKIPKLNPSKPAAIDQSAEATMMKPRVSDRARSEAPMVSQDTGPSQLAHHAPQSHQQPPHQPQQPQLSLAIVSAVKAAIITDPNFTAGLAATISSIVGRAHPNDNIVDNNNNKINDNNNDNNNNKINNDNSNSNNTTNNINFSSYPSSAELIQRTETTKTKKKVTTIYSYLRDKFIRL